jgi:hypothetical protein
MMKTTIKILLVTSIVMLSNLALGQAPEGVNYQATVRDASGNLMTNQSVAVIFTIKKTTMTGTNVYQENQTLTTNAYGGFAAIIGQGTATTGTFSGIAWGNDDHFLSVSVNGNNLGTTQMMSVPYALHAKTADKVKNPIWKKKVSNGDVFIEGEPVIIGDSVANASQLTIVDNTTAGEMIDLIRTNAVGGNDVINMSVTTTGVGQFLECATNGNNKLSLNTDGTMNIDSTIRIDDGEINRTQTSTANLVPIAYGYISATGSITASGKTNNFTVSKGSAGSYSISITGESFFYSSYVCNTSLSGSSAGFIGTGSVSGNLLVFTRNSSGTFADRAFYFIVYKP